MVYLIIYCNRCGTPQYINENQKTRICPRCRNRIDCKKMKVYGRAQTIREANLIIRSLKTPGEIKQRMAILAENFKNIKNEKERNYTILSDLITELLAIFPKAMPKSLLVERALELGIESEDIVEKILTDLNNAGLVIMNKSRIPGGGEDILLQFPSVPFKFDKMYVKKPKKSYIFQQESEKIWKKKAKEHIKR